MQSSFMCRAINVSDYINWDTVSVCITWDLISTILQFLSIEYYEMSLGKY